MKKLIFLVICAFAFLTLSANVNTPPTDKALVYKEAQVQQADAVIVFAMFENQVWDIYPPPNQTAIVFTKKDIAEYTENAMVTVLLTKRVNRLQECLVMNTVAEQQRNCDYIRVGYTIAY
jgi:hypothetical protein